jgi:hypothetical protein
MRELLRRNLFLVLGVSLPLVLILLIVGVQAIQRWGLEPPATPVVYVYSADWVVRQHLRVAVVDGELSLKLQRPEIETQQGQLSTASLELAVFAPTENDLQRYPIDLAGDFDLDVRSLPVPEALQRLELDPSPRSLEGARLIIDRRSSGGLFGEVFGFGRSRARYRLEIDEVGFDVPGHPIRYGTQVGFIAWVVSS